MTCLPFHGKLSIAPRVPSPLTTIGLIQPRPNSAAKNMPLNAAGNFVADGLAAS